MVITRKNRGGYITAFMEYRLKDKYDKNDFCYINDVWVHERYRNMGNIMYFIKRICKRFDEIKFVYFVRDKHGGRMSVYEVKHRDKEIKFKLRRIANEQ